MTFAAVLKAAEMAKAEKAMEYARFKHRRLRELQLLAEQHDAKLARLARRGRKQQNP